MSLTFVPLAFHKTLLYVVTGFVPTRSCEPKDLKDAAGLTRL
jgi:hypothetical protein